jgi:hypothetical protein
MVRSKSSTHSKVLSVNEIWITPLLLIDVKAELEHRNDVEVRTEQVGVGCGDRVGHDDHLTAPGPANAETKPAVHHQSLEGQSSEVLLLEHRIGAAGVGYRLGEQRLDGGLEPSIEIDTDSGSNRPSKRHIPSASVPTRTRVLRRCRSNRSMPSSRSVARASIASP